MSKIDDVLSKLNAHGEVLARLDERSEAHSKKSEDHDKRLDSHAGKIRSLEHWRYGLGGAIGIVAAWLKLK